MKEKIRDYDEGTEQETGGFFISRNYLLLLLFALVLWFGLRWNQENVPVNFADWALIWVGIAVFGAIAGERSLRIASPKMIGPGIDTTTVGEPLDRIGIYDVFTIGDIDAWEFRHRGSKDNGCIIVPWWCWKRRGRGISIHSRLRKLKAFELPLSVNIEVLNHGFKGPFYVSFVTEEKEKDMPEIQTVLEQFKQANRMVNMYDYELSRKFKSFGAYEEWRNTQVKLGFEVANMGIKHKAKKLFVGDKEVEV